MKDKNGINVECQNCASVNFCKDSFVCAQCSCQNGAFLPSAEAYEARIAELQDELNIIQKSERAEAQKSDRLQAEVKVLKAFVMKVHTSPVIFEDVNRTLRDEAKTLLENFTEYKGNIQ